MPDYKTISLAAAILCSTLFIVLMFFPETIIWLFQVEGGSGTVFMERRSGVLLLGIGATAFITRNLEDNSARIGISKAMFVTMAGLAVLGIFEFIRGNAGPGMFVAVTAEAAFAIGYFNLIKSGGKAGEDTRI